MSGGNMPLICSFEGIKIYMYFIYNEHMPPHIHAFYQGNDMIVEIMSVKSLCKTKVPSKIQAKILAWVEKHKEELMQIWTTQVFRKLKGNY